MVFLFAFFTVFQKGLWIRAMSIASPDSLPRIMQLVAQYEITDLYIQVVVGGYAYYKSEILPRSEYLDVLEFEKFQYVIMKSFIIKKKNQQDTSGVCGMLNKVHNLKFIGVLGVSGGIPLMYLVKFSPFDYDPLDSLTKEAKKMGLRVHAWVNTNLVWSMESLPDSSRYILHTHPEWSLKDIYGRSMLEYTGIEREEFGLEGIFIDPSNPMVREYLKGVCLEIISKYPVDGIHLDFIRYPGIFWGIDDKKTLSICPELVGMAKSG